MKLGKDLETRLSLHYYNMAVREFRRHRIDQFPDLCKYFFGFLVKTIEAL